MQMLIVEDERKIAEVLRRHQVLTTFFLANERTQGGGASLDEAELRSFLAETLAKHKLPTKVWFLDTLPRNANGKFVKRDLKEQLLGAS